MKTVPIAVLVLLLAACNAEAPPAAPTGEASRTPADAPSPALPPPALPPPSRQEQAPAPAQDQTHGMARFDGYGELRFGMTEAEARAAWTGALSGDTAGGTGDACHYLNPAWEHAPSYFAFMFEGGRFVRYDVGNDSEVAPGGGKRGMTADAIRELYAGRVAESPHKYVDGGRYLRIEAPEGDGVLVFETDAAGKVSEWHAGLAPQVDYIEGCS